MPTFNLVDQPWIPVRYLDENSARRVGLRTAFRDAKTIAAIVGPSPLATFVLYRLLLAIGHRALDGPATSEAWLALIRAGGVDLAIVERYLDAWHHRFYLFDPDRPFYQDPTATGKEIGAVSKLFQEWACGNNPTLFDHTWDEAGTRISPADAAVQLLVVQAYSLGGLVSVPDGADKSHKSAKAAPLVKTLGFLVGGAHLGEILTRNLAPIDKDGFQVIGGNTPDCPSWERGVLPGVISRWPTGLLDLLTWQSRRIRLLTDAKGAINGVYLFKGEPLPEGFGLHQRDPAIAFRRNRDPKAETAWIPLTFAEGRSLWRDGMVLTRSVGSEVNGSPGVLVKLADITYGQADFPVHWPLEAYGLASDQAKALFWRSERLEWPTAYMQPDGYGVDLATALGRGIAHAERTSRTLGGGNVAVPRTDTAGKVSDSPAPLRTLFRELGASPKDLQQKATGLGAEARFWAAIGPAFQRFLTDLPESPNAALPYRLEAMEAWAETVDRAARESFRIATDTFYHGGRQLKAFALADRAFRRQLSWLRTHYLEKEEMGSPILKEEMPA